jgi:hypothetical protein
MECKADKLMAYARVLFVLFFCLFLSVVSDSIFSSLTPRLRTQLNEGAKDFKLSVNDFVIKAAALTLQQHPVVNSEWKGMRRLQWVEKRIVFFSLLALLLFVILFIYRQVTLSASMLMWTSTLQ